VEKAPADASSSRVWRRADPAALKMEAAALWRACYVRDDEFA